VNLAAEEKSPLSSWELGLIFEFDKITVLVTKL
jgi:hypothetical protein